MTLIEAAQQVVQSGNRSEGQVLLDLARFGEPMLWLMRSGWFCKIEVTLSIEGAKFEVKSESDHKTPMEALIKCEDRLKSAISKIGVS